MRADLLLLRASMSHTAQLLVPFLAALIAIGLWLWCFAAIERLQRRATGWSRSFPRSEILTANHAMTFLGFTALAMIIYAFIANTLLQLSLAAACGLLWVAQDRQEIPKRFQTWPPTVAARLRIASVAASIAARVTYVFGIALLAIAVVNVIRG